MLKMPVALLQTWRSLVRMNDKIYIGGEILNFNLNSTNVFVVTRVVRGVEQPQALAAWLIRDEMLFRILQSTFEAVQRWWGADLATRVICPRVAELPMGDKTYKCSRLKQ